jgi:hypothetical protein
MRPRTTSIVLSIAMGAMGAGASAPPSVTPSEHDIPPFTIEVVPAEPSAEAPILVEVRLLGDPGANLAFADATPALDDLVAAQADGLADVPVPLLRVGPDAYWGVVWLSPGDWTLATSSDIPGGPGPVAVTVGGDGSNRCPVTLPGAAPEDFAARLFGSGAAVGNDDLWVGGLGTVGVMIGEGQMIEPDGSVGWKLGWWRVTPGALAITGQRLDADAKPLVAHVPDGYGTQGFQATGVSFPTDGCWEVTGQAGGEPLTFVTYVMRR